MSIEIVKQVAQEIKNHNGELWIIGGFVREMLYQQAHPSTFIYESKDIDCEVYGLWPEQLGQILSQFGTVDFVGQQFGVFKLTIEGKTYDISMPRSDSVGRKPDVEIDPFMDKYWACKRRNFTVNSAMLNPLDGELVDYFGAMADIKRRLLEPVSLNTFGDDPLRPLIGLFLAGAYRMWPTQDTVKLGFEMTWQYNSLPPSRVWGEWWKWATRSVAPSQGLVYLQKIGWLVHYPELGVLDIIPQDPEWHPEGDVWQHTLLTCNEAAFIARDWDAERRGILVLAALCHDLDKVLFTVLNEEGRWVSPGHDQGIQAEKFLNRIYCPIEIKERVLALVRTHMLHIGGVKVKRLLKMLGDNRPVDWLAIVTADHSARPPLPKETPVKATELYHKMINLPPDAIEPVVTGKHLMVLGIKPGPAMGNVLKLIYEGQLEGEFDTLEAGLRWAYNKGFIVGVFNTDGTIKQEVLNAKRNK